MNFSLPSSRQQVLLSETKQPYFSQIQNFLQSEKGEGNTIYPTEENIFKAFSLTPFDQVKVVILGQDPYHGPNQAMGLSFSVPEGVPLPPSLKNIYKELVLEYPDFNIHQSGDLTRRAEQGVLLLNTVLTVRAGEAGSHSHIGRQEFTDDVIKEISDQKEGIVFLLRGAYAQSKKNLIDTSKHKILESVHPSPLSAYRGRFGCNHFLLANEYLARKGKKTIQR